MLVESRGLVAPEDDLADVDARRARPPLGVYDHGYVLIRQRSSSRRACVARVRARNVCPRDRRARASDRVRRQRPARVMLATSRPDVPRSLPGWSRGHRGQRCSRRITGSRGRVRAGGRRRRDRGDRGRRDDGAPGDRRRGEREESASAAGGRSPGRRRSASHAVHLERAGWRAGDRRRPAARLRRMGPVVQLWRAAAAAFATRAARMRFVPDWSVKLAVGRGSRRRRRPDFTAVLARAGRRLRAPTLSTSQRDSDRRRRAADAVGARPALGRASSASTHDRHGAQTRARTSGRERHRPRSAELLRRLGPGPDAQRSWRATPAAVPLPVSFAAARGQPTAADLFDPVSRHAAPRVARRPAARRSRNVGRWKRPGALPVGRGGVDGVRPSSAKSAGRHDQASRAMDALDARQDRGRGTRRRRLPRPDVHEPHVERSRVGSIRYGVHAAGSTGWCFDDGVVDAPGRGSLSRDDHDRRRGGGAGPVRGVAPDRMARPARVWHDSVTEQWAVGRRSADRARATCS